MKKDAYYFPHFCNARHDRKVKRLRKELGIEGYGIFFMLLEVLREQLDYKYPIQDIDLLAEEFGTSEQKVRIVVCNYQLFEIDETEQFFSPKLFTYMQPYLEKSERARKANEIRWNKAKCITNGIQMDNESESISNPSKVKKSKVKESKVKYAEFVSMTETEYNKLLIEHGLDKVNKMITTLDNYKGSNNKKYASDYRAILNWVVDKVNKEIPTTENTGTWGGKKKWD